MIGYALQMIEKLGGEPLTLEEVKTHLRVDGDAENTLITLQMKTAREQAEGYTGRELVRKSIRLVLDKPCRMVRLPGAPLQSVTVVRYKDAAGSVVTMDPASYEVDTTTEPGLVVFNVLVDAKPRSFTIEYEAGYTNKDQIPSAILSGMLLQIGHLYANREGVVVGTIASPLPAAVDALWDSEKIYDQKVLP